MRAFFGDLSVTKVDIINDRESGRPRGFLFVEFASKDELEVAIGMNGSNFGGRTIVVNEAKEREGSGGGSRGRRDDRGGGKGKRGGGRERDDDYGKSWK
jgi:RNA recognition motif-containing protein